MSATAEFDISAQAMDEMEGRATLFGDGSGMAEILWAGASDGAAIEVTGGSTGASVRQHSTVQGFKINSVAGGAGVGILVDRGSLMTFEDIFMLEMHRGVLLIDSLSFGFEGVTCLWGIGIEAVRSSFSYPNSLVFDACRFGRNGEWASPRTAARR